MDCNTQFSETFRETVFSGLSNIERGYLLSSYRQSAFCETCDRLVTSDNEAFGNYISFELMIQLSHPLNKWPTYIVSQNMHRTLQCNQCEGVCDIHLRNAIFPNVLIIEFSVELMSIVPFFCQSQRKYVYF